MTTWNDTHDDTFVSPRRYRHKKTGGVYQVLFEGLEVTGDEGIPSVVYQSSTGKVFIQSKTRFEDGRFEKL